LKSYINVYKSGDFITHSYIEDGVKKKNKVKYKPFLAIETNTESKWTDIYGKKLGIIQFDSISEMYAWKKQNASILSIYADCPPETQFIAVNYKEESKIQKSAMHIANIDIEVRATDGFPSAAKAEHPVITISLQDMVKNTYTVFGFKEYTPTESNVTYVKCDNENDLFYKFLDFVDENPIDILTGWYIDGFDIPYLINRANSILPKGIINRLSPEHKINRHEHEDGVTFSIVGTIVWDYKELYTKFTGEPRERYSLDYISKFELGEGKLDFKDEDTRSLTELYDTDFKTFVEYNIKDTELVYLIDKKIQYIELALSYMYMMKCLPNEIFGTVKPWDSFLYHELFYNNKLVPPARSHMKEDFVGGYCMEPIRGLHRWVTVYDIVSSYPNQIRSFNMSPETIINDNMLPDELLQIREQFGSIEKCIDIDKLKDIQPILEKYDVSFTSNGQFFRRDIEGFIPKVTSKVFKERVAVKQQISKNKKLIEKTDDPELKEKLKYENSILDLDQYTKKIALNSLYGCTSNIYFRFFDLRIAEAITSNGQVCVRGATNYVEKIVSNVINVANDTDSMFVSLEKVVNERFNNKLPSNKKVADFIIKYQEQILEPAIHSFFNKMEHCMNMRELTISMEHECISDVCIFLEKKRYAMKQLFKEGSWFLDKTKLKIRGIEIVRTSTPQFVRDFLTNAVLLIFEKTNDDLINYVEESKTIFFNSPFAKVAFPRSCNGFDKYNMNSKAIPIALRAGMLGNTALKTYDLSEKYRLINEGDKIKFCYLKTPNKLNANVIAFLDKFPEELLTILPIDYKTQWEKAALVPLQKITNSIGWKLEGNNSIEDFF